MKSNKKTGKNRLDKYYHLAKEHGYRSRSAFKIIQIAKKLNIFQNCNVLVDLCAAPGGWLQVASKQLPVSSTIIGVDLVPIKPIKGVITFQSDIRTAKCRSLIMGELKGSEVDVVLHDGSPNMGCNWNLDAFNQNTLVLSAAKLACSILKKGGIFVTKIFRSSDYNSLIWMLGNCFERVKVTKPQSSRNVSAEIFAICMGFKTIKNLDPKLFNPDHIFINHQEVKTEEKQNKSLNQLLKEQKKSNREGYEEGSIYSEVSVLEFIKSDTPANVLVSNNRLVFSPSKDTETPEKDKDQIKKIEEDPLTTEEVRLLCSDLKVAGKSDLQSLLKWRFKLLKSLPILEEKKTEKKEKEVKEQQEEEVDIDEEEKKINDMIKSEKRKKERKERKMMKKLRKNNKETNSYNVTDPELFNLESLNSKDFEEEYEYSETESESDLEIVEYEPEESEELSRIMKMDVDLEVRHTIDKINEQDKPKNNKLSKKEKIKMEKSKEIKEFLSKIQYEAKMEAEKESESETEKESISEDEYKIDKENDNYESLNEEEENIISSRWFDQEIFNQDVEKEVVKKEKKNKKDKKQEKQKETESFEVVPAISNSEVKELTKMEEFEEMAKDPEAVAEVQALGSLMLNKKTRMELIDGAYNKKTFGEENLPSWFVDDENKHNKRQYPVTKELMKKYKAKLMEIKNRPIKKVLEAKTRKALRAKKRFKSILPKIEAIANDSNSTGNANKLLRGLKKIKSSKREKVYVISRKTGSTKTSKIKNKGSRKVFKPVDRRMKKDNRRSKLRPRVKSRKARIH